MAGGMTRGRGGLPMSERLGLTRGRAAPAGEPAGGGRHCWVLDAVDGHGVKRPGLLLEWRQAASGWEGRVVYTAHVRSDSWSTVEEWISGELLEPA